MEGCSNTEKNQIEIDGCLQAQFGLGAAFGPWDFKSPVSTDSTTTAAQKEALMKSARAVSERF